MTTGLTMLLSHVFISNVRLKYYVSYNRNNQRLYTCTVCQDACANEYACVSERQNGGKRSIKMTLKGL